MFLELISLLDFDFFFSAIPSFLALVDSFVVVVANENKIAHQS